MGLVRCQNGSITSTAYVRTHGKPPAGRKTRLRVCTFVGVADKSAFALLLPKVTKPKFKNRRCDVLNS